ncbi:protein of unknown function DUF89 [Thermodesulfatator indicus DSM 15286]|uniref:Damage-control phosphatase ARMT1-like metal-binding domain-containing protein n=1 Tax=Thermodesulfatator indicus (strain DSM 15286 / JCM 11887 / CIR29812) TaxID=667014 RepID=F8AA90_THEID|nr:ARMT1-like domain-containing protein [Thermodesulfatator indicus]AEH44226.1 protein of unknown function DUF89 [Thermodesulfatator indicus DSM 15286]
MITFKQIPEYCRPCLENLVKQAMGFACGEDHEKLTLALSWLDEIYDESTSPPLIASKLHCRIKNYCQNEDPYAPLKTREIDISRDIFQRYGKDFEDSFRKRLIFSLLGNTIDFFRPPEDIEEVLKTGLTLAIDHVIEIENRLKQSQTIILLTDNAGEVFFDLPLLKWFSQRGYEIYYAVKPKPIQNDLSLSDLEKLHLKIPAKVIATGAEMVGLDLDYASEEFKKLYLNADLVLAKGMGHFETLSMKPGREEIAFLLCAKCVPVATALKVPHKSYVVFLME